MKTYLKQFLEPPVFPGDEEKTRVAQILHPLLLSFLAIVGIGAVCIPLFFVDKLYNLVEVLIYLAIILAAYLLMRLGQIRLAGTILVAGTWLVITGFVSLAGGMTSAALMYYLVGVVFAGLLLGNTAAILVAALTTLVGFGLAMWQTSGYPLPRLFPMPPLSGWLDLTFSLFLIAVTMDVTLRNLRAALTTARQQLAHRQQAEEALRESERKFRDIARNIPGMVFQYAVLPDGSGRFNYASPRASEQFGLPADLQGQAWNLGARMHPHDRAAFVQSTQQAFAQRTNWHYEGRLQQPGGGFKWFQGIASPTQVGDTVLFDGILLDTTERKQAEASLQQSEEKYRAIFDNAFEGIYQSTPDGRFLSVNAALARMFGYASPEEMLSLVNDIGRQIYALPEDREQLKARLSQTGFVENYEAECHRKDGQTIWVSINMRTVLDAEETLLYYEGATLDITGRRQMEQSLIERTHELSDLVARLEEEIAERQRAETLIQAQSEQLRIQNDELASQGRALAEAVHATRQLNMELEQRVADRTRQLNQTNTELARAVRAKDEFLATMSHELRSSLSTILVITEILKEGLYGELSSAQQPPIASITESGQHLLALINDILDLAKFEAGKVELVLAPVEVEEVCQASLRLIQERAHKKRLSLKTEIAPRVRVMQADERRLKQILVNLLTNAVKFTPEAGEIGLTVSGQEDLRTVTFAVWDSGVGIATEELGKLFQPFVQLDNGLAHEQLGTGLGLALVRSMVELHGGSVSVESAVNQGSRFTVSLPWSQPAAAGATAPQTATAIPSLGQGQLILLAEDSELAIPPLTVYLQTHGYRVVVSRNGREALDLAFEECPALILMDVQMPKIDGLEAIRQLRARPETAQVPIIALTALAMSGDRERCLAAGANDYLRKPVSLSNLMQKINQWVASKGLAATDTP